MIRIHDRDIRGTTKTGWLDSKHTFSFGHFNDPTRMGFRSLRVINDDRVIPGAGFDTHGHADMEIVTLVLQGQLAHKDSLGNGSTMGPGEIQRMTAGTGIRHSEFNPSNDDGAHFLQIWILPERRGLEPSYEQKTMPEAKGGFAEIAGPQGSDKIVTIHQDVRLLRAVFNDGETATYDFANGRSGFLHVMKGRVTLNGEVLKEGDGAEITDMAGIELASMAEGSDLLLFDLR